MSMTRRVLLATTFAFLTLPVAGTVLAAPTTPNDVARFLAGMPIAADSAGAPFTTKPAWQQHARWFDPAWDQLDKARLSKIRTWSAQVLKDRNQTLHYMFSGPDFLYANAFFPNETTYLLSGLEPVGKVPEINDRALAGLSQLRSSLRTSMTLSFFITQQMKNDLRANELGGALPIILAYAARSGKTVTEIKLVEIDKEGTLKDAGGHGSSKTSEGAKVSMTSKEGKAQTLYYFRTDLSNSGVPATGFTKFAESLGTGEGMIKSASYLLHSGGFTNIRDFMLKQTTLIAQDDSGIPLAAFPADEWKVNPYGRYNGPIPIFSGRSQAKLSELYKKANAPAIDFGVGYRWRPNDSNWMIAVKSPKGQAKPQ